jgi:hypothetical protein
VVREVLEIGDLISSMEKGVHLPIVVWLRLLQTRLIGQPRIFYIIYQRLIFE